ncbi:MAG: M15 family metallopeptidase [Bacteroidales bacterium]|nr:M15 family metallopeptidase [Bacteroidales bacterium]
MLKKLRILLIILVLSSCFYDCQSKQSSDNQVKTVEQNLVVTPKIKPESKAEKCLQSMGLVNIKDSLPNLIIDLKYSTTDNFIGIDFYGDITNAFVQNECLIKLQNAYQILQNKKPEYTFIVFDAVRSLEAQQLMWDSVDVPQNIKHWYVANPAKGSIHNFGMALDISIIDDAGNVLDMGTEFDYFGELAYPNKTEYFYQNGDLSEQQYQNRNLLMSIMADAGFYVSKTEWWHYNAASLAYSKNKYEIFSLKNCADE